MAFLGGSFLSGLCFGPADGGLSLHGRATGSPTVLGKGRGSLPARVIPYGLRAILLLAQVVKSLNFLKRYGRTADPWMSLP